MDGRVIRRSIIDRASSAATSEIVKALLVTSLTHVSSAVASTRPSPFSETWTVSTIRDKKESDLRKRL